MAASGFLYGRKSLGAFKALLNCCTWCYLFSRGCCQTAPRSVRMHIEYEDLSAVKNFICRIGVLLIRSFQLCAFLSFQFGLISFNTRWDEQFYHCYFLCSVNWMNHPLTGSTERGFKKKKKPCFHFFTFLRLYSCVRRRLCFFLKNGQYHCWILMSCSFRPFLFVTLVLVMLNAMEPGIFLFIAIVRILDLLFNTSVILYICAL